MDTFSYNYANVTIWEENITNEWKNKNNKKKTPENVCVFFLFSRLIQ